MSESYILIGGSGHAKVVADCIRASGNEIAGILDDGIKAGTMVLDIPVLGAISDYTAFTSHKFVIAIGNNAVRSRLARSMDVRWGTVVHPSAVVSPYATLGAGVVVMPSAVINAGAVIADHCIINTGAVVEHDNILGAYSHISPNASLGGTVRIGENTHVGIGACVRNNIDICGGCVIGAGAAVVNNITQPGVYAGVPARKIQ